MDCHASQPGHVDGGAALAAGLALAYIVDRLTRNTTPSSEIPADLELFARSAGPGSAREETDVVAELPVADILERYRIAAAV